MVSRGTSGSDWPFESIQLARLARSLKIEDMPFEIAMSGHHDYIINLYEQNGPDADSEDNSDG